eukprot:4017097-Pleurochrysis_carterae.AAC.1
MMTNLPIDWGGHQIVGLPAILPHVGDGQARVERAMRMMSEIKLTTLPFVVWRVDLSTSGSRWLRK